MPKLDPSHYQAIIFDLGGVILNIDYQATKKAFLNLGVQDFDQHFSQMQQSDLFDDLEKGRIKSDVFREKLNQECELDLSKRQIDDAWNAMLLDLPQGRIDLIKKLKTQIPIYLFSNTNEIHIDEFNRRLIEEERDELFYSLFTQHYYSYEQGFRKPDSEGFQHIINENNLSAERCLFIDDSYQHIEGAQKVGLQTYFLQSPESIIDLFS